MRATYRGAYALDSRRTCEADQVCGTAECFKRLDEKLTQGSIWPFSVFYVLETKAVEPGVAYVIKLPYSYVF